jgi:hypothetical protein
MPGNRPSVQHIFDDEAPETGDGRAHVGVWCLACTGIHLVNRKTSRLVSASAAREENGWDECSQDDCPMLPGPRGQSRSKATAWTRLLGSRLLPPRVAFPGRNINERHVSFALHGRLGGLR